MKFRAVKVRSAPEALVEQVVREIHEGNLKPGARLPSQRELAAMFEVGLGTVREAVKTLHATGYLDVVQGKGTFIAASAGQRDAPADLLEASLDAADRPEIREALTVLLKGLAGLAAKKGGTGGLEALRRMARGGEGADAPGFWANFCAALGEAAGNRVLGSMAALLMEKHGADANASSAFQDSEYPGQSPAPARQALSRLVSAVEARDPVGAEAAVDSLMGGCGTGKP